MVGKLIRRDDSAKPNLIGFTNVKKGRN